MVISLPALSLVAFLAMELGVCTRINDAEVASIVVVCVSVEVVDVEFVARPDEPLILELSSVLCSVDRFLALIWCPLEQPLFGAGISADLVVQ